MARFQVFSTKSYYRDALGGSTADTGVDLVFRAERLDADTAQSVVGVAGVCVGSQDLLDRSVIESLSSVGCRIIALRTAGFNNVDLDAAADRGMTVVRVPAYSPYAVAEHAVALLLALSRKLTLAHDRVRAFNFSLDGLVGFDLHGKTAGVIGTGRIGQITAQILKGFGMSVLASDPFPNPEWADSERIRYLPLDRLLAESEVVTLHAPLTSETTHLINRETLATMRRGALLVNVSRGALVDAPSVIGALESGQLGGAGLDVYEHEEGIFFEDLSTTGLHDDTLARLLTFPNVIITSHQAFLTHDALDEIARVTVTNMARLTSGESALPGTQLFPAAP